MKRGGSWSDPELQKLLEHGRTMRATHDRLPDVVRARARARARAHAIVAERTSSFMPVASRGRKLRLAIVASLALAVGAASAAAFRGRELLSAVNPVAQPAPRTVVPGTRSRAVVHAPEAPPPIIPQAPVRAKVGRGRSFTSQESYAAELSLLRAAQVAYMGRNFSGALVLVGEHARQFPNGRLVEEREALRARSLVGSGRVDEARRAVAAFAVRFPRSVLLSRLQEATGAAE